jgi:hypothetical protein
MYALMLWNSLIAGVGPTIHDQGGFFCEPGLTASPIFDVAQHAAEVTADFPWRGASTWNAGWPGSPILAFDRSFKVHALRAANGVDMLIIVMNPAGVLDLDLHAPSSVVAIDCIEKVEYQPQFLSAGRGRFQLPPSTEHFLILKVSRA